MGDEERKICDTTGTLRIEGVVTGYV